MTTPVSLPKAFQDPERARNVVMIADSFHRLLGRPLIDPADNLFQAMWEAPQAILAHGTEQDPILYLGNLYALRAFETDIESLLVMPSRLTAEAPQRNERQKLLDRVSADGFIDDYSGVRISANGRRFMIENAVVWNVTDSAGEYHGQAATFIL